jgi:hypothetical protein
MQCLVCTPPAAKQGTFCLPAAILPLSASPIPSPLFPSRPMDAAAPQVQTTRHCDANAGCHRPPPVLLQGNPCSPKLHLSAASMRQGKDVLASARLPGCSRKRSGPASTAKKCIPVRDTMRPPRSICANSTRPFLRDSDADVQPHETLVFARQISTIVCACILFRAPKRILVQKSAFAIRLSSGARRVEDVRGTDNSFSLSRSPHVQPPHPALSRNGERVLATMSRATLTGLPYAA